MKSINTIILSTLLAASTVISTGVMASAKLYANTGESSVKVQVYQDGKAIEGASVKLLSNSGELQKEVSTSRYGYANFNNLETNQTVQLIAVTPQGESDSQWVMPVSNSKN